MAMQRKPEDGARDLFVRHLSRTEGTDYKTIASNVKTDDGRKDFDYLLQSGNGSLLALEIAQLADPEVESSYQKWSKVVELVEKAFETVELKSSIEITVPFCFPYPINVIKQRFAREKNKILAAGQTLGEDSSWVDTSIGQFKLDRFESDPKYVFVHNQAAHMFPTPEWTSTQMVNRLLPSKNEQLQYKAAKRRVLFLGNTNPFAVSIMAHSAITRAINDLVNGCPQLVDNIDEIHVAFRPNEIHCVSPLSPSCPLLPY